MKYPAKITAALLAGLALAGCTAAPSAPAGTAETAEVSAATPPAEATEQTAAPVLRELTNAADGRCYLASRIDETAAVYLTTLDLTDGQQRVVCTKPGCPHSDESCWGRMPGDGVARPKTVEVYTDGVQLYWILLTEYSHFSIGGVAPESAVCVTDLDGASCPPDEMLAATPNYSGNFLQDNSYMESRWFTDGETLWALITSNPPDETTGEQTFASTLLHFEPAAEGSAAPCTPRVVWRQVRDSFTDYAGLLDGQIVVAMQHAGPDTGSMQQNYENSTTELRVLGCDGTLGEPLLTYHNGDLAPTTGDPMLLDGQWFTMPAGGTDLQVTDLHTGESRTLCTLPEAADAFSVTPRLVYGGRLVVDVNRSEENLRYVVDLETGSAAALPATWAKDGVLPRVPLIRVVAGDRCLLMVGSRDRMLTTMGQDGGTYSFNSPVSVWAVADLGAYLDGDQNWSVCTVLDPDGNL